MVADPHRLDPGDQPLEVREVLLVERIDRADRQRHAVQRHRIVAPEGVEPIERLAARDHVVLAERLEPLDLAGRREDFLVVLVAQAQPETDFLHGAIILQKGTGAAGKPGRPSVVRSGPPQRRRGAYITLPPWFEQLTASLVSVKPWPLQAFWPLQALVALLHALWPLQALVPWHFTPPSAWAAVANAPAAKIDAAAATNVRLVMICSLTVSRHKGAAGRSCTRSTPGIREAMTGRRSN